MADAMRIRSLEVDLQSNTLRILLADTSPVGTGRETREPATIDIGTGGRLIGVELTTSYLDVMPPEPGTEHLVRSSEAEVDVTREEGSDTVTSITIPRRGEGYEITYPSGNQ